MAVATIQDRHVTHHVLPAGSSLCPRCQQSLCSAQLPAEISSSCCRRSGRGSLAIAAEPIQGTGSIAIAAKPFQGTGSLPLQQRPLKAEAPLSLQQSPFPRHRLPSRGSKAPASLHVVTAPLLCTAGVSRCQRFKLRLRLRLRLCSGSCSGHGQLSHHLQLWWQWAGTDKCARYNASSLHSTKQGPLGLNKCWRLS